MNMNYRPDFYRLRTAVIGGQPDRVPLFELHVAQKIKEQFLGSKITSFSDEFEFIKKAGYDYIKLGPILDLNPQQKKPKEGVRISQATEQVNERSWHASGQGIITSINDFENYRWPQSHEIDYSSFERIQPYLPEEIKIVAQYGDIFTWVWDFMGFETFSYALVDNEQLIQLMFDAIGNLELNMFETMASFDNVGALFYTDDIAINTGLFVSPDVYRQYLFPWMKRIGDICRKKDIPFIYHTDGNIWSVLNDIKACGVDAIHPIEPLAMDIFELKQKFGDQFCLIGNVDVDLLSRGTPEQVDVVVKKLIDNVAVGGGYCLGSGNSIPEYVKIENYRAMIHAAHFYGSYK